MHPATEARPLMRARALAAVAAAALLFGCANQAPAARPAPTAAAGAAPRYAPPADPYPSTYRPYPGVPTAITGATIFDGEGGRIENGTIVLADGRIQAVGGADTPIPEGATRIDGTRPLGDAGRDRRPQPPRRLSEPGRRRASATATRSTSPVAARSLGRAQRLAAGSRLQPRARQWRRHHAADPARLGQPVRRPRR